MLCVEEMGDYDDDGRRAAGEEKLSCVGGNTEERRESGCCIGCTIYFVWGGLCDRHGMGCVHVYYKSRGEGHHHAGRT